MAKADHIPDPNGPSARRLPDGQRLHLNHGPVDLIIGTDGDREVAFSAAEARFQTILTELAGELPILRRHAPGRATGPVATRMEAAIAPFAAREFITPMAAVAGAVADEMLAAILHAGCTARTYVNNGGDVALHVPLGASFLSAMATPDGRQLGRIQINAGDGIGGLATSGAQGRSHSLGIADSVTVLAETAAAADAAATLIANAVNCPDHPNIQRAPARSLDPNSDLGDRLVVTGVGPLRESDIDEALARGQRTADRFLQAGHISAAALFLRGRSRVAGNRASLKLHPPPEDQSA